MDERRSNVTTGGGQTRTGAIGWRQGDLLRWLPLLVLAGLLAVTLANGWHRQVTLDAIGLNYEHLRQRIALDLPFAILVYVLTYIAYVSLSIPGGFLLTISGGLLFGWALAIPLALFSATTGAMIVFLAARTSLGAALARRGGARVLALTQGFRDNAFSYLLFLRLMPVVPFFLVNLVASLARVPLATFVAVTFVGTIPATTAFSVAGSGLGTVVAAHNAAYKACLAALPASAPLASGGCTYGIDTRALVTPETLLALALLGTLALAPIAFKRWSRCNAPA